MKRLVPLLVLCYCWVVSSDLIQFQHALASESQTHERKGYTSRQSLPRVPEAAIEVYEYIVRTGRAPEGYVGGRAWENRERRLPIGGNYREYDIHPKVRGKNRGAERIIIDRETKNGWYTGDHYRTFILMKHRGNDK